MFYDSMARTETKCGVAGQSATLILLSSSAYHTKCVDPWLTKTKKTCPVCKQKVVPSQGDSDSDSEEGDSSPEENEEVSESTPLLRSLASTSAHSFGTMSGASRSEQDQESSEYEDDELDSSDSEEEVTVETVVVQMQQPCSEDHEHDLPRAWLIDSWLVWSVGLKKKNKKKKRMPSQRPRLQRIWGHVTDWSSKFFCHC